MPLDRVPQVPTTLTIADKWGTFKARIGVGRMHYAISPGLYAVGGPTDDSPVLVTANYRMTFDRLRSELTGIDAWIVALDTKGINVWCAAAKGTFGTDELCRRVEAVGLSRAVSHRRLILPQLSAPGIQAHEVRKRVGWEVVYGPVRAADIPQFLAAGCKATPEMRRVRFPLADRLVLTPLELFLWGRYALAVAALMMLLGCLGRDGWSWARLATVGVPSAVALLAAYLVVCVATPALLPWLPGRAFAVKGVWVGLVAAVVIIACLSIFPAPPHSLPGLAGWVMLICAVASFMAMNFTGASTFTSLSGVKREVRSAVPIQAFLAVAGMILWTVGRFA
jgi:acetyl-CoA decarbonylase/synthase complex subunit gamma